ncbi:MAG: competence/damage-inducible protein A [Clostridiales bacterium]|nr:competence/damage-inducible protein A [Clostridiales bacterium]
MNCEILSVGTELLMGQIANTNAMYISNKLNEIGVNVYYHSVVGDNPSRMEDVIKLALSRADLVLLTGGLGPTEDDLTKEIVSQVLGRKLEFSEDVYACIEDYFVRNRKRNTPNNRKQAYVPEGAIVVPNKVGTACGFILEVGEKVVIMLPGPPLELNPMLNDTIVPYLAKRTNRSIKSKYIKVFGLGEADVCDRISDLIESQSDPTIATYCELGEVLIRVTTSQRDDSVLSLMVRKLYDYLGEYIYSENGEKLEEVVVKLLQENKKNVACAESCTGGLLSAKLTSVSGSSQVFNRGIVSYSNVAKMENLNVPEDILNKFGAVSKETAEYMARGVREISNTDIGVSITGIAGPTGGTKEKPVGLVYIGLSTKFKTIAIETRLNGDRNKIRELTCKNVLNMIRLEIIGKLNK